MYVDPHLRLAAARSLLDAISVMDPTLDDNEEPALLALASLGLNLDGDRHTAAAVSAATDLLWFFFAREAKQSGTELRVVVSNAREHLLPVIYPDAI